MEERTILETLQGPFIMKSYYNRLLLLCISRYILDLWSTVSEDEEINSVNEIFHSYLYE